MTTRLVVIAKASPPTRRAITAAIRDRRVAWWHHFPESWLICDREGRGAEFWRGIVAEAAPRTRLLVVPAGDFPWAGVLRESETRWLNQSWKRG